MQSELDVATAAKDAMTELIESCSAACIATPDIDFDSEEWSQRAVCIENRVQRMKVFLKASTTPLKYHVQEETTTAFRELHLQTQQITQFISLMHILGEIAHGFSQRPSSDNLRKFGRLNKCLEGLPIQLPKDSCVFGSVDRFKTQFDVNAEAGKMYMNEKQAYSNLMADVCRKLLTGVALPGGCKTFKSSFSSASTKLAQLVQYSPHPSDDKTNLEMGSALFTLASMEPLPNDVDDYKEALRVLYTQGRSIRSFKTAVSCLLNPSVHDVIARWRWLADPESFDMNDLHQGISTASRQFDTFMLDMTAHLENHLQDLEIDEFKKRLEALAETPTELASLQRVKTLGDPLALAYAEHCQVLTGLVDETRITNGKNETRFIPTSLAPLKELLDKYDYLTVYWGVHRLLSDPQVKRVKEGIEGRQSLRKIRLNYPDAFDTLDTETQDAVTNVLSLDSKNDVVEDASETADTSAGAAARDAAHSPVKRQKKTPKGGTASNTRPKKRAAAPEKAAEPVDQAEPAAQPEAAEDAFLPEKSQPSVAAAPQADITRRRETAKSRRAA